MARKGSPEYKEARKQARRETFHSRSVYPKLVDATRAHDRLWEARNRGARTTQARKDVTARFAEYNETFDAGVARRMGEDKPKRAPKSSGRKTAHVPAGNANGGQFTGRSNAPSGGIKPKAAPKPRAPGRKDLEPLEAQRHLGGEPDPFAPPDPKRLAYVYGRDKLGRALQDYTMDNLKRAATNVQQQHPGAPKPDKRSKSSLIAYIVKYHDAPSQPAPPKPTPKPRAPRKPKASAPASSAERQRANHESAYRRGLEEIDADYENGHTSYLHMTEAKRRLKATLLGPEPKAAPKPRAPRKPPSSAARQVANLKRRASRQNMPVEDELAQLERMQKKPRKRKASASSVPRQGKLTRRTREEADWVYSEARRGLRNRRARGG